MTHQAIRGEVTASSTASVTVKAPDGYTATFTLAGSTKLRIRGTGKGVAGSAKDVHPGDRVVVVGTGADRAVATHLLDRGPAGKARGVALGAAGHADDQLISARGGAP